MLVYLSVLIYHSELINIHLHYQKRIKQMDNHNANFITKKADIENVVDIIGLEDCKYGSPVSSSSVPG